MSTQDWTPVVFKKSSKETKSDAPKVIHTQPKISLDEDGQEVVKLKLVTKEMSRAVIDARTSQKLSQKELGVKCNLDSKIINEIERGGCVYNADHLNKIARALGVKIPRDFPK
jgi:ribosome-binding protein aMBF1 (putative translation factor)